MTRPEFLAAARSNFAINDNFRSNSLATSNR
jgi:hypothetical protein